MNSETTKTQPFRTPVAPQRSGAVAAGLSTIFPGLGQAYLGDRRTALTFALPVVALIAVGVLIVVSGAALRFADPTLSLGLFVVVILFGIWWLGAIVHAWNNGVHNSISSAVIVGILLLAVGGADAWAAVSVWRVRNAIGVISAGNPLDATAPPPKPGQTPLPVGQTPDPAATPTQRPPDYNNPSDDPNNEPEPTIEPGATPGFDITQIDNENDGLLNVLLVGLDWQPGRTSKRTDTILVVSANSDTGEVLMFSFPRDSAHFPLYNGGTYSGKINTFAGFANRSPEVYPEGGMRSLAYQVGYLLGIPIDYYASVNMPGFMSVVEQVGGITVTNTRDIRDNNLQFYLPPGEYRLNPADALRYVRSRHGSGGDFGRAERQQQVLSALRKELLKPQNLAKLPDIVEAMSLVLSTDFPLGQIDQLVQLVDEVDSEVGRSWIFGYPQWAENQRRKVTGVRSAIVLRMDRIATLSIELFGEKSQWAAHRLSEAPAPPTL